MKNYLPLYGPHSASVVLTKAVSEWAQGKSGCNALLNKIANTLVNSAWDWDRSGPREIIVARDELQVYRVQMDDRWGAGLLDSLFTTVDLDLPANFQAYRHPHIEIPVVRVIAFSNEEIPVLKEVPKAVEMLITAPTQHTEPAPEIELSIDDGKAGLSASSEPEADLQSDPPSPLLPPSLLLEEESSTSDPEPKPAIASRVRGSSRRRRTI